MKYDVVALGELLIDFTFCGDSQQGNPIMEGNPGGAVCNVLSLLSKLGYSTGFIGKVGNDMFGRQLRDALVEVGINTEGLVYDEVVKTTLAFVHTFPNGDRDFSFYRNPGADMMLSENEINTEMLENAKVFHFGSLSMTSDICFDATRKALRLAKESGAIITFDPNLREPLWDSLDHAKRCISYGLENCDVLKISDNEISWLTGCFDYDEAAAVLRAKYPNIKLMMVSMGPEGSKAFSGSNSVTVKPFLNKNTIETTGAGDTFFAGVIRFVLDNGLREYSSEELTSMLTFANAAASIITTRKGALRVMPSREEIEALVSERS